VSGARTIRNLALVGFMGTGKSTVGQLVAAQLRFRFLDTDDLIESRTGKSIQRIFNEEGENRFREYECAVVEELKTCEKTVIAAGGGLIADESNLAGLKIHALVVCLWASPDCIWDRVRNQTHRPLLQTPDPRARIRELLAAREPFYRRADVLVNTERRSAREVAHHVLHQFQMARGGRSCP
jgi:shikimate kinase